MQLHAFVRWENEGSAMAQDTIDVLPASTARRKPPLLTGDK